MPEKPQILFVLGGPGSGKGTQCDIMKAEFGFKHFSVGELIREIIQSGNN
jgi:adenylate kinase family enzyme